MGQSAILGKHPTKASIQSKSADQIPARPKFRVVDLKNIGAIMMGHKLTGSEHVLRFGWNVEATVIVANDTGFDFKATVKKNAWGTPLDIYQFCPFKKF